MEPKHLHTQTNITKKKERKTQGRKLSDNPCFPQ